VTGNLWGERWSKLVTNAMANGIAACTGLSSGEMLRNDPIRHFSTRVGSEAIRVGQALGYELEEIYHLPPETIARGRGRRICNSLSPSMKGAVALHCLDLKWKQRIKVICPHEMIDIESVGGPNGDFRRRERKGEIQPNRRSIGGPWRSRSGAPRGG
jgi:hypothetical protein